MKPFGLAGQGFYGTHDIHIPPTFNTPGVAYSPNVKVNGLFVHRLGDKSEEHTIPPPLPPTYHPEFIVDGIYDSVLVNGRPVAPLGASVTNTGKVLLGSYSVFIGGGTSTPPAAVANTPSVVKISPRAAGAARNGHVIDKNLNDIPWELFTGNPEDVL